MKAKASGFFLTFGAYCIIFLIWHNWNLTTKEIAEMIFIGTWVGVWNAIMMNRMRRLVENIVKKLVSKDGA